MSLCGLHRRLRGAIVGHLALFEMTSSIPNRRYASGLRRLGFDTVQATGFFDEHVEADAVHENIAAVDLAGGLARQEPALAGQILWGARALVAVEGRWARQLMAAWEAGRSSLRDAGQRGGGAVASWRWRFSAPLGAEKRVSLWVPSQNGRRRDFPQRQSAIVSRRTSISRPSWSTSRNGPRTTSGPSRYGVMTASPSLGSACPGISLHSSAIAGTLTARGATQCRVVMHLTGGRWARRARRARVARAP